MKKILFLLVSVSLLTFDVSRIYSQLPTLEWARFYPDSSYVVNAFSYAMVVDNSSNVYITGYDRTMTGSPAKFITVKYNPSGNILWVNNFFGYYSAYAKAIAFDKDGNIYVTGGSTDSTNGSHYVTVSYNASGLLRWFRYYTGPVSGDIANKIGIDVSGNIYVSGLSDVGGYNYQIATIKYTNNGDQIWVQRYGIPGYTFVEAMTTDSSCNLYIAGEINGSSISLKYDSSGNLLWARNYRSGNFGNTLLNAIVLDKYNNIYVTGYTQYWDSLNQARADFLTIKYSSTGDSIWANRYHPNSNNSGGSAGGIAIDNEGFIYVTGIAGTTYSRFCTIKYSSSGDTIWTRMPLDSARGGGWPMINLDSYNNVYIAASLNDTASNEPTYGIYKYDTDGNFKYLIRYYNSEFLSRNATDFAIGKDASLLITGWSGGNKMCTVKYSQPNGINNISNFMADKFLLSQNYPNPFNPSTFIRSQIARQSIVTLKIFDILGRLVEVLVDQNLNEGLYSVAWDGSRYASGIYFYTLEVNPSDRLERSEGFIQTRKMILLK